MLWGYFTVFLLCFVGRTGCLAWILGHSYVCRGALQADLRRSGRQLGFDRSDLQVRWMGVRGMLWHRVLQEVQFYAKFDRFPDLLLLHVGGNDMAARSSRELIRDIKTDLLCLWSMCPDILVIWSDMVARRVWRGARSVEKVNRARGRVNKEVGRFIKRNGGLVVRHRDLEVPSAEFLADDGVHLNPVGNAMWFLGLQEGLETALRIWRDGRQ